MRAIRKMQRVILALFILTLLAFCGLRIYRRLTVDVTPPVITCSTDSIDVSVTAGEEALLQGVMASDDRDGDLTDQILIKGVSPSLTDSSAQVTYIVKVVITAGGPQLITLSDYLVYLPRGSAFDAAGYIQSVTAPDGTALSAGQVSIESPVDTSVPGTYHVGYSVTAQGQSYTVYLAVVVE